MKKALGILLALVLVLAFSVPVMAQPPEEVVPTDVEVTGGTTTPPIIKAKWEQDDTDLLEDGDPTHEKYIGNGALCNAQFLPSGQFEVDKIVEFWVIVTDPEGVATVSQVVVDVYHPDDFPEARLTEMGWERHKYQIILTKVDKFSEGIPAYEAAKAAHLVTYQNGYTDTEIMDELKKCTAEVYKGVEVMSYRQPQGKYKVVADACDQGNSWASEASPATTLENNFTYVCTPGFEIDFNKLDYGTVEVSKKKWIAGNTIWMDSGSLDAAPDPNPATIRNIGNTDLFITVHETDMDFGHSGVTPTEYCGSTQPPDGASNWNVIFDARLGSDPANEMYFDPCVPVTLPNKLKLCNKDELDFSIHVIKSTFGPHSGWKTLGCEKAPW